MGRDQVYQCPDEDYNAVAKNVCSEDFNVETSFFGVE